MSIRDRLSGNEAIATAMRQINPDVFAMFPITPSTEIPQYFTSFVSNGQVDTVFIPVESEHSAMSACIGSEAAGGETIYANGKWKEGWKDKKLRVAMNEFTATTNRVSSDGQTNPFYEWRGTDKLVRFDQIENEEAVTVLTAEAAANDGHLFVDTAPHFIEKEHEDIPEDEERDDREGT